MWRIDSFGRHRRTTGKVAFHHIKIARQKSIPKATVTWLGCFLFINMCQDWYHHCWLSKIILKVQDSRVRQMIQKFGSQNLKTSMTKWIRLGWHHSNFMLYIMGNLPKKYEAVLKDLENKLMTESSEKHTIEPMNQKLNAHFKRL